jgi:hypothetical protein
MLCVCITLSKTPNTGFTVKYYQSVVNKLVGRYKIEYVVNSAMHIIKAGVISKANINKLAGIGYHKILTKILRVKSTECKVSGRAYRW